MESTFYTVKPFEREARISWSDIFYWTKNVVGIKLDKYLKHIQNKLSHWYASNSKVTA